MRTFGIISEFNPFHNGHKRIIEEARKLGADEVVCIMSGNAVQRGELALFDKYTRAETAVRCGADLVLELPFPWCSASAESFAKCAVKILSDFCTDIIFGSECGDIEMLKKAAEIAGEAEFYDEYKRKLEQGERAAFAYSEMLEERGIPRLSSNDLLGVEYIKAAKKIAPYIVLHTVKREGSEYNCQTLGKEACPSATAIRNALKDNEKCDISQYIPIKALETVKNTIAQGEMFDMENISSAVLTYFRLASAENFSNIADTDGGIANRICTLARSSKDLDELFENLKTKRYTDAKLRRAVLFCLTGVTKEILSDDAQYTVLLGANQNGRELLSRVRKTCQINIVTKPADAPKESDQYKVSDKLEALFVAGLKTSASLDDSYRKKAFICDL